jgi:lipoprotein-anchoring transpeptidase ErfK/SrfK
MSMPSGTVAPSPAPGSGFSGLTRRSLLVGLPLFLAACQSSSPQRPEMEVGPLGYAEIYGPVPTEPFPIPAVPVERIDPTYFRQEVDPPVQIGMRRNTLVVDPANRFLYHVRDDGSATRYGVGVGRDGFAWDGDAVVGSKQEWPKWFPPDEMIARDPRLKPYDDGMEGGLNNPLGARALYLYQGRRDTLYRIHGTNEPWTVGKAVSSGCIRMINQDAIHLYARVEIGTPVVVLAA